MPGRNIPDIPDTQRGAYPHQIDHIRLFPRSVHGVEIINACRNEFENKLARQYAENYDLIPFAGSDNHRAGELPKLAGMCCNTPIENEADFIRKVKNREMQIFFCEAATLHG